MRVLWSARSGSSLRIDLFSTCMFHSCQHTSVLSDLSAGVVNALLILLDFQRILSAFPPWRLFSSVPRFRVVRFPLVLMFVPSWFCQSWFPVLLHLSVTIAPCFRFPFLLPSLPCDYFRLVAILFSPSSHGYSRRVA